MTVRTTPEDYLNEETPDIEQTETIGGGGDAQQVISLIENDNFIKYFVVITGTVVMIACLKYIIDK